MLIPHLYTVQRGKSAEDVAAAAFEGAICNFNYVFQVGRVLAWKQVRGVTSVKSKWVCRTVIPAVCGLSFLCRVGDRSFFFYRVEFS